MTIALHRLDRKPGARATCFTSVYSFFSSSFASPRGAGSRSPVRSTPTTTALGALAGLAAALHGLAWLAAVFAGVYGTFWATTWRYWQD